MPKIDSRAAQLIEKMIEDGVSTREVAQYVGVSQRSIQYYVKAHRSAHKDTPWIPFGSTVDLRKERFQRKRADRRKVVVEIIGRDNCLNQRQIIDELPANLQCSIRSLRSDLKALGLTRKMVREIPIERNIPRILNTRQVYARFLRNKPNELIFFLDESGFNLHTGPRYGYAMRGESPSLQVPGNREKNQSLLVCIGVDGIVDWQQTIGSYNAEKFANFLRDLRPLLPENSILIMDNAKAHHGTDVHVALNELSQNYKYLPAWSPQLNPVEQVFASLKARQARFRPRPRNNEQLQHSIMSAILSFKDSFETLRPYYDHMREYLRKSLNREQFL